MCILHNFILETPDFKYLFCQFTFFPFGIISNFFPFFFTFCRSNEFLCFHTLTLSEVSFTISLNERIEVTGIGINNRNKRSVL